MPAIRIKVDAKGIQRFTDFTFDPGELEITVDGRDVQREWVNNESGEDPGVNVGQSEILGDLVTGGITLELAEDGTLSVVEE